MFLTGAAGYHHDPLPFADRVDRPSVWRALVIRVGVLARRVKIDGFREAFVEDRVKKALSRDTSPFERDVGKNLQDIFGVLNGDGLHMITHSNGSSRAKQRRTL